MREVFTHSYKISTPDGIKDYDVRTSLVTILFIPGQNVNIREAIERDKIAQKIENSTSPILLEDAEWERLKKAVEFLKDVTRHDIECMKRVLDAKLVEVEKKGGESSPNKN